MGAQDVEREGAQAGEDPGPAPDAAGILAQDAVADVVIAVLDPPVRPDGTSEALGIELDLAHVVRDLAPGAPQASAGVLAPTQARDAGSAGDQVLPRRREVAGDVEDLDATVLLSTMAGAFGRRMPVCRRLLGAQAGEGVMQAGLVGLEPDQQGVAGARRGREAFFDRAAHRR